MSNIIDFAIVYWGLTRSTKKVYKTHYQHIFDVLKKNNKSFHIFMHTWKTNDNKQKVWEETLDKEIDYEEYKLLNPDYYKIDNQDDFLKTVDMDQYFYKDIYQKYGESPHGEWLPTLVTNHICALESLKRALRMVSDLNSKYTQLIFVRPDSQFSLDLPLQTILQNYNKFIIPDFYHFDGFNDRFAVVNYENALIYANRIDSIAEFRKNVGRIVSERYLKYTICFHNKEVYLIDFPFETIRP